MLKRVLIRISVCDLDVELNTPVCAGAHWRRSVRPKICFTLNKMVIISKTEKRAVFNYLLREGVITVRKDSYLPKHQHLDQIPNLKVQMLVKSLKSKGYLNEVFSWNWSYYTLTNAGVAYLVKTLGVSADVVPLTFKKKRVVAAPKADDEGDEKPAAEEVAEAKE